MRGNLVPPLANVELHHPGGVDGVPLVRVDHHTEQARVGLNISYPVLLTVILNRKTYINQLGHISRLQIPEDRGLVEIGQIGDIIELFHLGRVDLLDLAKKIRKFVFRNYILE